MGLGRGRGLTAGRKARRILRWPLSLEERPAPRLAAHAGGLIKAVVAKKTAACWVCAIAAPHGFGELIAPIWTHRGREREMKAQDLGGITMPYPTYSDASPSGRRRHLAAAVAQRHAVPGSRSSRPSRYGTGREAVWIYATIAEPRKASTAQAARPRRRGATARAAVVYSVVRPAGGSALNRLLRGMLAEVLILACPPSP